MGKHEIAQGLLILSCFKDLSQSLILRRGSILPPGERRTSRATPWLGNSAEQERSATLCVPTIELFQHLALIKIQCVFSPQGTESCYDFYTSCSSLHYGPRLPSIIRVFGVKGANFENSWDHWSVGNIY